ncbi:hypothetical protein [Pseudomonas sp.]|jgi:hypothetical protein|uniref:hypothetical protein n=1 Tax=Pseudomonas sp. TaxID=306 RepID=UPI002ED93352
MQKSLRAVAIPPSSPRFVIELPVGSEYLCVRHLHGSPHLYFRSIDGNPYAPHGFGVVMLNYTVPVELVNAPYIDAFVTFEHEPARVLLGGLPVRPSPSPL